MAIYNEIDDLKNRRYDPTPILTDMVHNVRFRFQLIVADRFLSLILKILGCLWK